MKILTMIAGLGLVMAGCGSQTSSVAFGGKGTEPVATYVKTKPDLANLSVATFAGGCFWCVEGAFERIEGVVDVISGYAGGPEANPTYEQVGSGATGHAEAVQVFFDPKIITYDQLLNVFFTAHDPTQLNRQGPDVGRQYRSAIFYHDAAQEAAAREAMKRFTPTFEDPIKTELVAFPEFWVAEDYHQNYYELHPNDPYVRQESRPKVERVMRTFPDILKEKYKL